MSAARERSFSVGMKCISSQPKSFSEFDADVAHFGVEFHRMNTAFAADAGLFRAAERRAEIAKNHAFTQVMPTSICAAIVWGGGCARLRFTR